MNQQPKKQPKMCDGHVWTSTTSPLIERCGRAGCRAMRQYLNGVWTTPQAPKSQPTTTTNQPGFWA